MAIDESNMMTKLTSSLSGKQLNTLLRNEMLSQIASGDNGGLVFICGKEEISYPCEILCQVLPSVSALVPESKDCCDLYRQKDAKIFITLDDVRPDTVKELMDIILKTSSSDTVSSDVIEAARMFGAEYLLPHSNPEETEVPYSEDENEERMLQDVTEESEILEEASECLNNEPDIAILKLSEDFFNSIVNEIIAEDVSRLIDEEVEFEAFSNIKEVNIEKDIQSEHGEGSLTWNDIAEKPVNSFYSLPESNYYFTKEMDKDETDLVSTVCDKDDIEEDMFVDIRINNSDEVDHVEDELMKDCQVDESILEGSTVYKAQESKEIEGHIRDESAYEDHADKNIEDDIADTCDAGIIDRGFIEERDATRTEDADLSNDEISTINNKFDEEMRVFLQPSPETVNEEIKEEEFCRNLEDELPTSEPNGEFIPVCDLNLEGTVPHDVVDGYSDALNSEDMQVHELKILTGQTELCEGDPGLTSPSHSTFKVESTEFVEDGLVDNLENSTEEIGAAWDDASEIITEPLETQLCDQDNSKNVVKSIGNDEATKTDDMNDILDHNKEFFEGFQSASESDDEDVERTVKPFNRTHNQEAITEIEVNNVDDNGTCKEESAKDILNLESRKVPSFKFLHFSKETVDSESGSETDSDSETDSRTLTTTNIMGSDVVARVTIPSVENLITDIIPERKEEEERDIEAQEYPESIYTEKENLVPEITRIQEEEITGSEIESTFGRQINTDHSASNDMFRVVTDLENSSESIRTMMFRNETISDSEEYDSESDPESDLVNLENDRTGCKETLENMTPKGNVGSARESNSELENDESSDISDQVADLGSCDIQSQSTVEETGEDMFGEIDTLLTEYKDESCSKATRDVSPVVHKISPTDEKFESKQYRADIFGKEEAANDSIAPATQESYKSSSESDSEYEEMDEYFQVTDPIVSIKAKTTDVDEEISNDSDKDNKDDHQITEENVNILEVLDTNQGNGVVKDLMKDDESQSGDLKQFNNDDQIEYGKDRTNVQKTSQSSYIDLDSDDDQGEDLWVSSTLSQGNQNQSNITHSDIDDYAIDEQVEVKKSENKKDPQHLKFHKGPREENLQSYPGKELAEIESLAGTKTDCGNDIDSEGEQDGSSIEEDEVNVRTIEMEASQDVYNEEEYTVMSTDSGSHEAALETDLVDDLGMDLNEKRPKTQSFKTKTDCDTDSDSDSEVEHDDFVTEETEETYEDIEIQTNPNEEVYGTEEKHVENNINEVNDKRLLAENLENKTECNIDSDSDSDHDDFVPAEFEESPGSFQSQKDHKVDDEVEEEKENLSNVRDFAVNEKDSTEVAKESSPLNTRVEFYEGKMPLSGWSDSDSDSDGEIEPILAEKNTVNGLKSPNSSQSENLSDSDEEHDDTHDTFEDNLEKQNIAIPLKPSDELIIDHGLSDSDSDSEMDEKSLFDKPDEVQLVVTSNKVNVGMMSSSLQFRNNSGEYGPKSITSDSESDSDNESIEKDESHVGNVKELNKSSLSDDSDQEDDSKPQVHSGKTSEEPNPKTKSLKFDEASLSDDSDDEEEQVKTKLSGDKISQRSLPSEIIKGATPGQDGYDEESDSEEEDYDVVDYDDASNDEVGNSLQKKIPTLSSEPQSIQDSIANKFDTLDEIEDDDDDDEDDDDDDELDEEIDSLYNEIDTIMKKPKSNPSSQASMPPVTLSNSSPASHLAPAPDIKTALPSDKTKLSHSIEDLVTNNDDSKKAKLVDGNMYNRDGFNKIESGIKRPAPVQETTTENKKQKVEVDVPSNAIGCHICPNTKIMKCYDFLQHLATHYSKQLFDRFPLEENEGCQVCLEERRGRVYKLTKNGKSNYIAHIGKVHLRVLELLEPELQERLVTMLKKYEKKDEENFIFLQPLRNNGAQVEYGIQTNFYGNDGNFDTRANTNYESQYSSQYQGKQSVDYNSAPAPRYSRNSISDLTTQQEYSSQPVADSKHQPSKTYSSQVVSDYYNQPVKDYNSLAAEDYNSQTVQDYKKQTVQDFNLPLSHAYKRPTHDYYSQSVENYDSQAEHDYNNQQAQDYNSQLARTYDRQTMSDYNTQSTHGYNTQLGVNYNSQTMYSSQPAQGYNSQPTQDYNSKPAQDYNSQAARDYNSKPAQDYNSQPAQDYNSKPAQDYNSQPAQSYNSQPAQDYNSHPAKDYSSQPLKDFNYQEIQAFNSQSAPPADHGSHQTFVNDSLVENSTSQTVIFQNGPPATLNDPPLQTPRNYQTSAPVKYGQCCLCGDEKQHSRGQLLNHLVVGHFYKEVSSFVGNNFTVDKPCEYCVAELKYPPVIVKNKNNYVRHVGTIHQKVLQFAPPEMIQVVAAMGGKGKTVMTNQKGDDEEAFGSHVSVPTKVKETKKEKVINLPEDFNVIAASNPHQKQFPSIPSGLKITKSKKVYEGGNVMEQMKNIGSNLKIERVVKENTSPPLLPCGECSYKAENRFNLGLHMKGHQRAAAAVGHRI